MFSDLIHQGLEFIFLFLNFLNWFFSFIELLQDSLRFFQSCNTQWNDWVIGHFHFQIKVMSHWSLFLGNDSLVFYLFLFVFLLGFFFLGFIFCRFGVFFSFRVIGFWILFWVFFFIFLFVFCFVWGGVLFNRYFFFIFDDFSHINGQGGDFERDEIGGTWYEFQINVRSGVVVNGVVWMRDVADVFEKVVVNFDILIWKPHENFNFEVVFGREYDFLFWSVPLFIGEQD